MRIREVEELVGITKKNIRFYEEQGLLKPGRESGNGYREYSQADVDALFRVKLLRKLAVPIDEIRRLESGLLTLEDCMRRHSITLERERQNLEQLGGVCAMMGQAGGTFESLDVGRYLQAMEKMEKEGVRFMDIRTQDRRAKKKSALVSSAAIILIMAAIIAVLVWAYAMEPIPAPVFAFFIFIPLVVIIGVVAALVQRMKEIKGGEEDDVGKY